MLDFSQQRFDPLRDIPIKRAYSRISDDKNRIAIAMNQLRNFEIANMFYLGNKKSVLQFLRKPYLVNTLS